MNYIMKKVFNKIAKITWQILGVIYFPAYVAFWLLHKIARLMLAIAYFGMLEKQTGKDIIKSLFKWHGRY